MRLAEENPHLPVHKEKKKINSIFFGLHYVSDLTQRSSKPKEPLEMLSSDQMLSPKLAAKA